MEVNPPETHIEDESAPATCTVDEWQVRVHSPADLSAREAAELRDRVEELLRALVDVSRRSLRGAWIEVGR